MQFSMKTKTMIVRAASTEPMPAVGIGFGYRDRFVINGPGDTICIREDVGSQY